MVSPARVRIWCYRRKSTSASWRVMESGRSPSFLTTYREFSMTDRICETRLWYQQQAFPTSRKTLYDPLYGRGQGCLQDELCAEKIFRRYNLRFRSPTRPTRILSDVCSILRIEGRKRTGKSEMVAFFLHLRTVAFMNPNSHRIHPYEVLNLVIPYHIKLLLASRTWLVGKN